MPLYWGPTPVTLPFTGVLQAAPEDQGSRVCVLQTGGKVACDDGMTTSTLVPSGASALSGGGTTCAVVNGGVVCADGAKPLPAGSGVTSIAIGSGFGCVVTGGTVQCWGDNSSGQLGDGTTISRATPAPVVGISAATALAAGARHACALLPDGTVTMTDRTVTCWGSNREGRAGSNPGWLPAWQVPGL